MARKSKKPKVAQAALPPIAAYEHAREVERQQSILNVISPEQRAKGTYVGSSRIVNIGQSPVLRWHSIGRISETQLLAIQICYRLWDMVGLKQATTASYGERIPGNDVDDTYKALTVIEAKEDLERIENYVPLAYWSVFENVCRFDEPAGIAGSRLGFGDRSAQERAHTVVCLVADTIAMKERLIPVTRILTG